ncbi:PREDICTED: pentatricopeptide repeat-containing protein At5g66520-like [Nelumbo nucifera]|nr:PREDICTED: pentatricopeptide repeat-containing protein At5g66520-like [Nelumbo nucifera]
MIQIKQIHAQLTTTGLMLSDVHLQGRFLSLAASLDSGDLHYPALIFSQLHHPNIFFYNTMIRAYSMTVTPLNSISVYTQILQANLLPDIYTFPFLLKACSQGPAFVQGQSVHGQAVKFGLDSYIYVNNALIHFYSITGHIEDARQLFDGAEELDVVSWNSMISSYARIGHIRTAKSLFDQMPDRNTISWSALIAGYVQCGLSREALSHFSRMQAELIKPNEVTLVSVLSACAQLGALEQGKWVHGYLKSNNMEGSVFLGTSLIDMYAKCGEVELAKEVFNGMKAKNLLAWTTMIKGLAMHGRGQVALALYSDMEMAGIVPDDVTFIGVLCACTHSGLVDQGRQIFESMSRNYGILPKIEHYGCMVDLLARCGLLDEAKHMVDNMPMEPDALIWGALMAGCRYYRNVELAEYVGKQLIQLEPDNGGVYVLLANIYAASGRLQDARKVREMMETKGIVKVAGCSVVEIRGTVYQFIVGDTTHPQIREILMKWEEIEKKLELEGYCPNKTEIFLDIDEEDKEEALARHSEKLAIAFALIDNVNGVPIRIVKNLRVCSDCHTVTKLISKIYNREIVVRDRTRFHLFKDGSCTCKDYW